MPGGSGLGVSARAAGVPRRSPATFERCVASRCHPRGRLVRAGGLAPDLFRPRLFLGRAGGYGRKRHAQR